MSKHSYEALRSGKSTEQGLEYIVILRIKSNGDITAAVFLVDTYCLGVKDAFMTRFGTSTREEMLERIFPDRKPETISPACAKKLILDAVAYARSLGLQPYADFQEASTLLNGVDATTCDTKFEFGKDGKPLYIQGPNESAATAERILSKLRERCGEGNYHFLVPSAAEALDKDADFVEDLEQDLPQE